MTATKLYDIDPEFKSFIACWITDRCCPEPLVDWLLDREEYELAEAARWATKMPENFSYEYKRGYYNSATEKGKCFPGRIHREKVIWQWIPECMFPIKYSDSMPIELVEEEINFNSAEEAILYILEAKVRVNGNSK